MLLANAGRGVACDLGVRHRDRAAHHVVLVPIVVLIVHLDLARQPRHAHTRRQPRPGAEVGAVEPDLLAAHGGQLAHASHVAQGRCLVGVRTLVDRGHLAVDLDDPLQASTHAGCRLAQDLGVGTVRRHLTADAEESAALGTVPHLHKRASLAEVVAMDDQRRATGSGDGVSAVDTRDGRCTVACDGASRTGGRASTAADTWRATVDGDCPPEVTPGTGYRHAANESVDLCQCHVGVGDDLAARVRVLLRVQAAVRRHHDGAVGWVGRRQRLRAEVGTVQVHNVTTGRAVWRRGDAVDKVAGGREAHQSHIVNVLHLDRHRRDA